LYFKQVSGNTRPSTGALQFSNRSVCGERANHPGVPDVSLPCDGRQSMRANYRGKMTAALRHRAPARSATHPRCSNYNYRSVCYSLRVIGNCNRFNGYEAFHWNSLVSAPIALAKAATGVTGFDEITFGGIPAGRATLLCGGAGCGKTLFSLTFLINGITRYGENGVFMSFEEPADALAANSDSLGFHLNDLVAGGRLAVDYVRVERGEIEQSGEYDLEGLFVRLAHAIDTVNAKRVVLDTLEALFGSFSDTAALRSEFRRLFAWLRDKGVTAVITAERGKGELTRFGFEEYVSDCVVFLDHRVLEQITTRRVRIVKYRGSAHGTNEYPFLIDADGISVLPITSAALQHIPSSDTVSTGTPGLDAMLGVGGFYKGSSVLISGVAGTGKSTFAATFVDAACKRGERCLFFAFEESPEQIERNMRSVGLDLSRHVKSGLLRFEATRPSVYGFEMHLARMNRDMQKFEPAVVIVDPISAFRGPSPEIHATLMRLVDICKSTGITALFTSLTSALDQMSDNERDISSLMDCWMSLQYIHNNGEYNRVLHFLKSRGMSHSNRLHPFWLTDRGIDLADRSGGAQQPAGTAAHTGKARG
jgi:circadian clock protein KaiC